MTHKEKIESLRLLIEEFVLTESLSEVGCDHYLSEDGRLLVYRIKIHNE